MALQLGERDWRSIAEKASKEMDPEKLVVLIAQLCSALDEQKARPQWQRDEPSLLRAIRPPRL
jgi:hypothetical protein